MANETKPPWVIFRGGRACNCLVQSVPIAEAGLRRLGEIKEDISGLVTQWCYNPGGVAASAGQHDLGGTFDVVARLVDTDEKRACWFEAGIIPFYRITADAPVTKWPPHGHLNVMGCPHRASGLALQEYNFRKTGHSGLANGSKFRGKIPNELMTWTQAVIKFREKGDIMTPEQEKLLREIHSRLEAVPRETIGWPIHFSAGDKSVVQTIADIYNLVASQSAIIVALRAAIGALQTPTGVSTEEALKIVDDRVKESLDNLVVEARFDS